VAVEGEVRVGKETNRLIINVSITIRIKNSQIKAIGKSSLEWK
jgi:hypothetical protein